MIHNIDNKISNITAHVIKLQYVTGKPNIEKNDRIFYKNLILLI